MNAMAIVPGDGSPGCGDGEQIADSISSSQTACRNEPTRCGNVEQSSGCDNGEQLSFSSATVAQRVIVKEWGATDHHGAAMVLEQEGPLISISF